MMVGIAIVENVQLDVRFSDAFTKMLLGMDVGPEDLADVDPDIYRHKVMLLRNNLLADLGFVTEADAETASDDGLFFVATTTSGLEIPLIENGNYRLVTESSKEEYLLSAAKYRIAGSHFDINANLQRDYSEEIDIMLTSFHSIIPLEMLLRLTPRKDELKRCLFGEEDISVEDWKRNTHYGTFTENDDVSLHVCGQQGL